MKKIILIILILIFKFTLLLHKPIYAEDDVGRFVRLAIHNRREYKIAKEQIELSKIRVVNAARVLGPSIMIQYREADGATINDDYKAKSYVIKGNQTLFVGGKKYNTLRRELKGMDVANGELGKVSQGVKFEVIKAYYTALLLQEKIRNSNMLLEECRNEFLVSQKKYNSKLITTVEYLEVSDLKKEIELDIKMRELEMKLAILDVKAACALDFDTEISVENDILVKEEETMDLSIEQYKRIALKNRPEFNAVKAMVDQTMYDKKVTDGNKWPVISVEGAVGKSGEAYISQELTMATEWSAYAMLEWLFWGNSMAAKYGDKKTDPETIMDSSVRTRTEERFVQLSLLDRLDYYYEKQEKKVSYKQALKERDNIEKAICKEVEKSYSSMKIAVGLMELAQDKLELYERKVKIVEKKNFLGEVTTKELLDLRLKLSQQRDSQVEAIAKYNIAVTELKISSGINVYHVK